MKKYLFTFLLTVMLFISGLAAAGEMKLITLKGGSILKGEVIQLKDGIYTLDVPTLGRIDMPESNIVSITSLKTASSSYHTSVGDKGMDKQLIKDQVSTLQQDILTDPAIMTDIQDTFMDEEIQKMLSDPKLLDDVLSYDPERMQQSDNVQDLIQNEKMQELIKKIQQKISPEGN